MDVTTQLVQKLASLVQPPDKTTALRFYLDDLIGSTERTDLMTELHRVNLIVPSPDAAVLGLTGHAPAVVIT